MLTILFFSLIEKFQKKTLGKIKIQQTQRKKKKRLPDSRNEGVIHKGSNRCTGQCYSDLGIDQTLIWAPGTWG